MRTWLMSLTVVFAAVSVLGCGDGFDDEQAKTICDQEREAKGAFVTDEAYQQCLDCYMECGDLCSVSSSAIPTYTCQED